MEPADRPCDVEQVPDEAGVEGRVLAALGFRRLSGVHIAAEP